jgi:hypothetical protein
MVEYAKPGNSTASPVVLSALAFRSLPFAEQQRLLQNVVVLKDQ